MKKTLLGTTILLGAALVLSGCNESSTTKNTTTTTTTNPVSPGFTPYPSYTPSPGYTPSYTPNPTSTCLYGSGYEPGIADSGQTIEYYRLNNPMPTAHGANQGVVVFSTETDLPNYNQNIFFSDSRLNVRIIPKYKYGGVDSRGVTCGFNPPQKFTKMNFGVVVRSRQSSPGIGDYREFRDVNPDCPSKVHQFQVPSTPDPLVIEVMNVQWDWSCISYANQGFPNQPGYCPYANVWSTECYSFEIQFSTDTTKDLPGTRY
jgi:hypothetical protein